MKYFKIFEKNRANIDFELLKIKFRIEIFTFELNSFM